MRYAQDTCMNIARACYEQGFREDGAMLSEYDPVTGHASQRLSWWEQNEAVVGFLNAWEVTGEEKYLDASLQCFDFADKHFVDHEKGGWFAVLSLDGTQVLSKQKANGPTCPYHNGACAWRSSSATAGTRPPRAQSRVIPTKTQTRGPGGDFSSTRSFF